MADMWGQLTTACYVVGAVWLGRFLWLLVAPVFEVLWPEKLLDRLHTRAVLITGCDSGFGEGLARRLDALGVPVFAGCLFPEGPGAKGLRADCSSRLRVLTLDVTSEQQVADAVTAVTAELSTKPDTELWAVVNNAGIASYGEIDATTVETFDKIIDVNTMGPVRVTKAFLPLLKKSRGRVVNVASPLGRIPVVMFTPYCMAKSALIAFSDLLRLEMKQWSVSVCTIEPGLYKTPITCLETMKTKYGDSLKISSSAAANNVEALKHCEKQVSGLLKFSNVDISYVVDEMVTACLGQNTKIVRIPKLTFKLVLTIFLNLPQKFREVIIEICMRVAPKI